MDPTNTKLTLATVFDSLRRELELSIEREKRVVEILGKLATSIRAKATEPELPFTPPEGGKV